MLHIKLDEIPIIRDVIDRAEDYAVRRALVRRIFLRLEKTRYDVGNLSATNLIGLSEDNLGDLLEAVTEATTAETARRLIMASTARNAPSGFKPSWP